MKPVVQVTLKLASDPRGATAIEYALIAALIAVALIASVFTMGGDLFEVVNRISNAVKAS